MNQEQWGFEYLRLCFNRAPAWQIIAAADRAMGYTKMGPLDAAPSEANKTNDRYLSALRNDRRASPPPAPISSSELSP